MTDFNFTIRAKDNLGAYTDREFSITVNNTSVDNFVAATTAGNIIVSPNGFDWTTVPSIFTFASYVGDVINANGFWLLTTSNTTYKRSVNGREWVEYSFPTNYTLNNYKRQWAYGDGKVAILLIGDSKVNFFYTEDGIEWIQGGSFTAPNSAGVYRLTYGNGIWMTNETVSNTTIGYRSTDNGDNWSAVTYSTTRNWSFNHYFNGLWLNHAPNNIMLYSYDTIDWFTFTNPLTNNFTMDTMVYGNGILANIPALATTVSYTLLNRVITSTDGLNWTTIPTTQNIQRGTGTSLSSQVQSSGGAGMMYSAFYDGVFVFGYQSPLIAPSGGFMISNDGVNFSRTFSLDGVSYESPNIISFGITGLAATRQV